MVMGDELLKCEPLEFPSSCGRNLNTKTFKHTQQHSGAMVPQVPDTHQSRGAQKGPPSGLAHRPKVQLLQALRARVHKGGGEGRVIGLHH